jgi:hypothetical protein
VVVTMVFNLKWAFLFTVKIKLEMFLLVRNSREIVEIRTINKYMYLNGKNVNEEFSFETI